CDESLGSTLFLLARKHAPSSSSREASPSPSSPSKPSPSSPSSPSPSSPSKPSPSSPSKPSPSAPSKPSPIVAKPAAAAAPKTEVTSFGEAPPTVNETTLVPATPQKASDDISGGYDMFGDLRTVDGRAGLIDGVTGEGVARKKPKAPPATTTRKDARLADLI